MKKLLILLLSLAGLANANATVRPADTSKIDVISQIDESSLLTLEHAKDFQQKNQEMDELAWHSSHYSHSSHESHSSHYSSSY